MITNNMSWGEIPDSSFLFRNFNNIKWISPISDEDLYFIYEVLFDTIYEIDQLDIYDYEKARLVFNYMDENTMFAWCINFNKVKLNKYPFMQRVNPYIRDYLNNLDRCEYGVEKTLYIVKNFYNEILCSSVDWRYFNDKKVIEKIADILFIHSHILGMNDIKSIEDKESMVYDILDKVIEIIDVDPDTIGFADVTDAFIRTHYGYDPSTPDYEESFQEVCESIREGVMDYVHNILKYGAYRDSPLIKESYDNITQIISSVKKYFDDDKSLFIILILTLQEVLLSLALNYEEQVIYHRDDAYELTKFVKFLFSDNLINC